MAQGKLIDGKYEYFAFISYKEEDAEWAKLLQRKLEHYKLPTAIRKEKPELPERISPIYEYKSEAGGGRLKEVIWKGLTSSKYLIVICSPRAGGNKSQWINNGIHHFIESGKEENIIPFIVEGKPKSDNSDEECFPSALLELKDERELRGINIDEMGRDAAVVKVVSRMFNVKFDTLWQRYEREQKQARNRKIGMIASIVSAFAFAALVFALIVSNKNTQLDKKNKQLNAANIEIVSERNRAENARDSLKVAFDSIALQNNLIQQQRYDLDKSNNELQLSNINLKNEKTETQKQYAKYVAQKANDLMDDNDYLGARRLIKDVLPLEDSNNAFPYIPEVEQTLRRSFESKSAILHGHTSSVRKALFNPSGTCLVSYSLDDKIIVWNAKTGAMMGALPYLGGIYGMRWLPKGDLLIQYKDSFRIWNIDSEKVIRSFKTNGYLCEVSDDSRILLISGFLSKIINSETGKTIASFPLSHTKTITSVSYCPSSNVIAIASYKDGTIKVWDTITQKMIREWKGHQHGVQFLHYNKTGDFLLSGGSSGPTTIYLDENGDTKVKGIKDDTIKIWNTNNGELIKAFPISVNDAIFSPKMDLIIASKDNVIYLIDIHTGEIKKTLRGHNEYVTSICISPNGKIIASTSHDGSVRLWDADVSTQIQTDKKKSYISSIPLVYSPVEDKCIVSSNDSLIAFTPNAIKLLEKFGSRYITTVSSVRFNKKGDKIIVSSDGSIYIMDAIHYVPIHEFVISDHEYADISPNDRQIVSVCRNNIHIWNMTSSYSQNEYYKTISCCAKNKDVTMAGFSPDGKHIVSASSDGIVKIWSATDYVCVDSLMGHEQGVNSVFYSPDGKNIITSSADKTIKIWDVKSRRCIRTLKGHTDEVLFAEFSSNGKMILSTSVDNTARIWDSNSGVELMKYYSIGSNAAFSKDCNKILLVNRKNSFSIIDFLSYEELIKKIKSHFDMK